MLTILDYLNNALFKQLCFNGFHKNLSVCSQYHHLVGMLHEIFPSGFGFSIKWVQNLNAIVENFASVLVFSVLYASILCFAMFENLVFARIYLSEKHKSDWLFSPSITQH